MHPQQTPDNQPIPVIVLAGPTAVGKTELALDLAQEFNAEIIGVDSMQIYKFMDIGTAKPSAEERGRVPHHLIDYVDPATEYNVSRFVSDAEKVVIEISQKGKIPLMTGGTGLYFKSFFEGLFTLPAIDKVIRQNLADRLKAEGGRALHDELMEVDPKSGGRIHENDTSRLLRALEIYHGTGQTWSELLSQQKKVADQSRILNVRSIKICLDLDRDELYGRINRRVDNMIDQGLVEEVTRLLDMGYSPESNPMQSLGYRHIQEFMAGKWSWQECLRYLARDTRRYAKRQLTWFRKDDEMTWFSPNNKEAVLSFVGDKIRSY